MTPPILDLPPEEPRDWEADLAEADGPPPPALSDEESAAERQRQIDAAAEREQETAARQALAAQTELGHSLAEDYSREVARREATAAVPDEPSANLYDGRPHFLRAVEGEPDRCGQDGEVWPCRVWREHIGPRMAEESAGGVVQLPAAVADERREAAAALLGISADQLDTMLQRHDSADR